MAKVFQTNMNLHPVPGSQMRLMWAPQREKRSGFTEITKKRILGYFCILDAINEENKKLLVISQDTDVMLLLIHLTASKLVDVWMISGTAKNQKWYPVHSVAEKLSTTVKDITLPCIDRLRYYLFFQWLWQENILQSTVSCWGYWSWWRFGTCRTVRVQTVWNTGLKNCGPS